MRFDFAHNALRYLIRTYSIKEMYIPYYLCDVVRHTLFEENCKPKFYHIDDNFMPIDSFGDKDFVLYPNYFGICDKNVCELARIYPKLIVDNAHAYYSKPNGFASFNAAYKFNEGNFSVLWTKKSESKTPIFKYKEQRKKVFLELDKVYGKTNLLNIDKSSNPFCYPYLAETEEAADEIVQDLTKKRKIIYRYWKPLPKSYNEYKFYSKLVPIPICS